MIHCILCIVCGETGFVSNEQVAACSAHQPNVNIDNCDLNALAVNQFDVSYNLSHYIYVLLGIA